MGVTAGAYILTLFAVCTLINFERKNCAISCALWILALINLLSQFFYWFTFLLVLFTD